MPRRRELRGVADGLLGSFVSRNNDVDGYWALGKLLLFALARREPRVVLDLVAGELRPPGDRFVRMAARYREMLLRHVEGRRLSARSVAGALLEVSFGPDPAAAPAVDAPGGTRPFTCRLVITDDRGGTHEASRTGWCRPHCPSRESKSART